MDNLKVNLRENFLSYLFSNTLHNAGPEEAWGSTQISGCMKSENAGPEEDQSLLGHQISGCMRIEE
jgi:hypothetical protein